MRQKQKISIRNLSYLWPLFVEEMNYEQTVQFLMQQLPMFSHKGSSALKPGLQNITAFCEAIGNPQNNFPSIHIAGTNGKGSVSHLLASALQLNGYKVGLYTSPHLIDFRERFRINGELIAQQKVVDFVEENKKLIETIQPSYFELSVALAFQVFSDEKVDVSVIEVGLGGRLDSTNIIHPELSVITQIGYDHMAILGNTLTQIAREKAGIIKEKIPVVIGETHRETASVFKEKATSCHAPILFADQLWETVSDKRELGFQQLSLKNKITSKRISFKTDLLGAYQKNNIKTAIVATQVLNEKGWNLPLEKVLKSLEQVKKSTGLHGRWEILQQHPKIILEVAHNIGGIAYLAENLKHEKLKPGGRLRLLIGFVKDKDLQPVLPILPKSAIYYFTQAHIPRALEAAALAELAFTEGLVGKSFVELENAVTALFQDAGEDDLLLITGSFFIVGEAYNAIQKHLKTKTTFG